jgi:hypothetical protein
VFADCHMANRSPRPRRGLPATAPRDGDSLLSADEAVPLTAAECPAVLAGLQNGLADSRHIQQRIIAAVSNKRLWHTAEWKQLRARLLKSHCEQCGTTEGPYTLQHLWHPRTVSERAQALYAAHKDQAWQHFAAEHAEDPAYHDRYSPDGDPRPGCPQCGGGVLQERKSAKALAVMRRFRCGTQRNNRYCHHEFDETVVVQPIKLHDRTSLLWQAFRAAYVPVDQATTDAIYIEATMRAVEEFATYMAGEGTLTFCQPCAYKWDVKGLRLCVECRDGWHEHRWARCRACATGSTWVVCETCGKRRLNTASSCLNCDFLTFDSIE